MQFLQVQVSQIQIEINQAKENDVAVHQELEEISVVVQPHAVLDVVTMVIHFQYTPFTHGTMVSLVWLQVGQIQILSYFHRTLLAQSHVHRVSVVGGMQSPKSSIDCDVAFVEGENDHQPAETNNGTEVGGELGRNYSFENGGHCDLVQDQGKQLEENDQVNPVLAPDFNIHFS